MRYRFVWGFVFGVCVVLLMNMSSCSNNDSPVKTEVEPDDKERKSVVKHIDLTYPAIVPWMYLDDSLRNVCRPLFYQLPWMESDIRELPEVITPEILRLSAMRPFEVKDTLKKSENDSLHVYSYFLKNSSCECIVMRIYSGNPTRKGFDGFSISESIRCNYLNQLSTKLKDEFEIVPRHEKKSEPHGHDH